MNTIDLLVIISTKMYSFRPSLATAFQMSASRTWCKLNRCSTYTSDAASSEPKYASACIVPATSIVHSASILYDITRALTVSTLSVAISALLLSLL